MSHLPAALLRAVLRGRRLVKFPGATRIAYLLSRFLPGLYERIMVRRSVLEQGLDTLFVQGSRGFAMGVLR